MCANRKYIECCAIRSSGYLVLLNPYWLEKLLNPKYSFLLTHHIDWKAMFFAVTDKSKQRRLPSSYADMRKTLPSASGVDLTIMRQRQKW